MRDKTYLPRTKFELAHNGRANPIWRSAAVSKTSRGEVASQKPCRVTWDALNCEGCCGWLSAQSGITGQPHADGFSSSSGRFNRYLHIIDTQTTFYGLSQCLSEFCLTPSDATAMFWVSLRATKSRNGLLFARPGTRPWLPLATFVITSLARINPEYRSPPATI